MAWAAFVNAYSPLLIHTARKVVRERDAAMDAYTYALDHLRERDFARLRRLPGGCAREVYDLARRGGTTALSRLAAEPLRPPP